MDVNRYVTFDKADVLEALEDLYEKKTGNKIDLHFNDANIKALMSFMSLTFSISIEGVGKQQSPPELGMKNKPKDEIKSNPVNPWVITSTGTSTNPYVATTDIKQKYTNEDPF